MGTMLNESDIQTLHELLDVIFTAESEQEAVNEALGSLKTMIESDESAADAEDEDAEDTSTKEKVDATKQHILTTKPDFFEYLVKLPEDKEDETYVNLASSKSEVIVEMLRNSPAVKLAFVPLVDSLLKSSFRDNRYENSALRAQDEITRSVVAELLRPDPAAEDANKATEEALSMHIQRFSDILSPKLLASDMTEALAKKQQALALGLLNTADAPLKPNASPAFVRAGGLDALLAIIYRGPLSISGMESPNESVEDACNALQRLMDDAACEELAQAFVERQAVSPLVKHMSYVCGLEGIYNASDVVRKLITLSQSDETLREQVTAEAKNMIATNPEDLGPGAAIVLWNLLKTAEEYDVEEIMSISKSKKYVPFFLAHCRQGTSDDALDAVGDALAARVGPPSDQLLKGISTPDQVERFILLIEYACMQSAADISSTIQVLRELVLPTDPEDSGGWFNPDEDVKRINKEFCKKFGKAIRTRYEAAQALAPKDETEDGSEVQEPSEEGLANMKNVKMLAVIVDEQYSAGALLAEDLLDYVRYLIFNTRSPLSRRAGLELITALTHNSSLSSDFRYVPLVIEAFQPPAVMLLDDPRALIRSMAMEWLVKTTYYRHPNAQMSDNGYKPAIDFVMKNVTEEKLVQMLQGTENEAKVAASMIEAMARHSTGPEVREKLRKNQQLVEGLWNGVFWDSEKAPEDKDEDISDDAFLYGNIRPSSGDALTEILDPFLDRATMITHITPHLAQAKEKESYEFTSFITDMPAVASLAVLAPETGVLSAVAKLISDEEQLPYAMSALQHLSRGLILAKWSLGQSDEIYPAIVKMLQKGDESIKNTILSDLEFLIYSSTVTKMKFIKSGGIKPLLEAVGLEDERVSRKAIATLIYLVTDYPEGAKAVIDAGAVEILKTKDDSDDIFKHKTSALELLETLKDVPEVDRIELTVEAYTALGKQLSEPGTMERLVENLKSSTDEKHLAIAGEILPVFADMLRSSSNPFPILEALYAIYVGDGVVMSGANVAASVGVKAGLPDALRPLVQSEDEKTKEYAVRVLEAVTMRHNDEPRKDEDENEQQDEQEENAEAEDEDEADNKSEKEDEDN